MSKPNTPDSNATVTGAAQQVAGQPDKANGTVMVVVGCKLPHGIVLEAGRYGDPNYTRVRLNGSNSARVVGGYGLTDVSRDFWETWYKGHRNLGFVRDGFVFVHGDEASAAAHAREQAGKRTGLEPLDPTRPDPRVKGIVDRDGKPLVEVDANHFQQGRRDVAEFGRRAAG